MLDRATAANSNVGRPPEYQRTTEPFPLVSTTTVRFAEPHSPIDKAVHFAVGGIASNWPADASSAKAGEGAREEGEGVLQAGRKIASRD